MDLLYLRMHQPLTKAYVQRVQQHIGKLDYTLKDLQETGLMMSSADYIKSGGETDLRSSCTDVVWYALNSNIAQCLDSGFFIADINGISKRSKTLDVVEKFIYEQGRN